MSKQIIACGDGMLDGKSPFMDLYILSQAQKKNPKILLLPTASGDSMGQIKYFYDLFERFDCRPSHLSLFNPHTKYIEEMIMAQDVIYITGGQSKTMMGAWKEWNVDHFLHNAYENGTVLSGGSAGSVCWFDECITDSFPPSLSVMPCLGFLPYSNCPHYASHSRRSAYGRFISNKEIKDGYAADDHAALHFVDGKLHRAISNRPYAHCYKVSNGNGRVVQERLKTHWLGMRDYQEAFIFNSTMFEHLQEVKPEEENIDTAIVKVEENSPLDTAI